MYALPEAFKSQTEMMRIADDLTVVNVSEAQVRAQFESMLLEPMLQPLTQAFGEYGDIASQSFAEALAKELSP